MTDKTSKEKSRHKIGKLGLKGDASTQKQPTKDIPHEPSPEAALQQQVAELTDALQRERADATNLRRRHEDQMTSLRAVIKAGVVRDILPVIDNFDRALRHVPQELADNQYVKGVQAVVKQFDKTLADIGVERIKTVGEVFDPTYHEAVSMEEGDGNKEIVSEELQSGYRLGDEIIRHAMVRVSMKP